MNLVRILKSDDPEKREFDLIRLQKSFIGQGLKMKEMKAITLRCKNEADYELMVSSINDKISQVDEIRHDLAHPSAFSGRRRISSTLFFKREIK